MDNVEAHTRYVDQGRFRADCGASPHADNHTKGSDTVRPKKEIANLQEFAQRLRQDALSTTREWLVSQLMGMLAAPQALTSIRHPLGFTCIPVSRAAPHGICVHFWNENSLPEPMIHSHSWSLLSKVVVGTLGNVIAEVSVDTGAVENGYKLYHVRSEGDIDLIVPTERTVEYRIVRVDQVRAGKVYALPAGVFHKTWVPAGRPTVTVAYGRTVSAACDLVVERSDRLARVEQRERQSTDEAIRTLQEIIRLLHS